MSPCVPLLRSWRSFEPVASSCNCKAGRPSNDRSSDEATTMSGSNGVYFIKIYKFMLENGFLWFQPDFIFHGDVCHFLESHPLDSTTSCATQVLSRCWKGWDGEGIEMTRFLFLKEKVDFLRMLEDMIIPLLGALDKADFDPICDALRCFH